MSIPCNLCTRRFVSEQALHSHCVAKSDHAYCESCERTFSTFDGLNQHLAYASVHQDESDSDGSSNYDFETQSEDSDESGYCSACNRAFVDRAALYQHLNASPVHNWCFICSKDFSSAQALNSHNSSRVHKNADRKCPLCPRLFKSPSDIAGHIEAGGCNPRITRHNVTSAVHRLNIHPTISINRRLTGPSGGLVATTAYSATELAFNGRKYECYLCHREFQTLSRLNTHLSSPAHDEKQFKCPHAKCGRQFTVISALIRHIESEACGLAKFQTVEDYSTSLTNQFSRMLTL